MGLRSGVETRPLALPALAFCLIGFSVEGFLAGLAILGRGSIFSVAMLLSSSVVCTECETYMTNDANMIAVINYLQIAQGHFRY